MMHWGILCFILTFRYIVATNVISEADLQSGPLSAYERNNATNDNDQDRILLTVRQATGSVTCSPYFKAFCEEKGETCMKHLDVYQCFVPDQCSEPCKNDGLCFNGRCICPDNFIGPFCEFHVPCYDVHCQNGGVCVSDRCICHVQFTGELCEIKLACGGLQCMNGGSCINDRCICPGGYAGDSCEIDLHSCDGVVCTNGQCVHGKCYCNEGWTGVRCEKISPHTPCDPDPCSGDCRCFPSCRHSNGYQCVSEGGYIGRNCSIPVPTVSCRSDAIVVTISKLFHEEFDRGAKNSYIYMSPSLANPAGFNKSCRAIFEKGNYVIRISRPWNKCGMVITSSTDGDLVIRNKLWINKVLNFGLYDSPLGVASIQCTYKSQLDVSTSIAPSVQLPRPTVTGVSQHNAEITLCKVSTCSQACPDSYKLTGTAVYTVGQFLHVGIDMFTSSLSSSNGVLQSASISCSPASVASSTTVTLFKDGCPTANGLLLQAVHGQPSLSRPHHICLSFRLPRSAQCAQIFIHAHLSVCHTDRIYKVCANGGSTATRCTGPNRQKRASEDDYIRPVFGPIYLVERGGATERVTYLGADQPVAMRKIGLGTPSVENSSGSFAITAVGSGLLLTIASTVVTLLCLKRKGQANQVERYDL